mmetsp:Transcript_27912/g.69999  ORF Transcript_27912/g.69999 Transcript_27912/m.69999 type:complete len:441 (+) Transcript_27912:99-1421(+)
MTSWQDIQEKTFTRWVNEHLKDRGMQCTDLFKDLRDGVLLINLLEIISGKALPRHNKNPRVPHQKYENTAIAVKFVQDEGIKLVNIGGQDITDGNRRIILGLIWTLILRYQVNKGRSDDSNAKDELLRWVQSKIPEYGITGFKKDWNDGRALCALTNAIAPGSCPEHKSLDVNKKEENCERGLALANAELNIPRLLEANELANPRVDEQSVMTYISYFRNAEGESDEYRRKRDAERNAARCRAYGPGLVECVAGEGGAFTVDTPLMGDVTVTVRGPNGAALPATVGAGQPQANGRVKYECSYDPKDVGEHTIKITFGGIDIPGSEFHANVLAAVSLGGEGKIRVFYSTTSSTEKGRSDVINLQRLLEAKKVHLRPDFEPWIAVDIMDKEDRDAVFKKAGTKVLPIVFIDDVYVGDHDTCVELEETGKLNQLLKYNERQGR